MGLPEAVGIGAFAGALDGFLMPGLHLPLYAAMLFAPLHLITLIAVVYGVPGREGEMSTCRSCRAPIVWAITAQGYRMPVNEKPAADGNLAIDPLSKSSGFLAARYLKKDDELRPGEWRGTSHFATCPNAGEHRKGHR